MSKILSGCRTSAKTSKTSKESRRETRNVNSTFWLDNPENLSLSLDRDLPVRGLVGFTLELTITTDDYNESRKDILGLVIS